MEYEYSSISLIIYKKNKKSMNIVSAFTRWIAAGNHD
jgi:hypothetical protein